MFETSSLEGRATTPWAPLLTRARNCPPYLLAAPRRIPTVRDPPRLLVSDRGAGWAGEMDDFEAIEADFAAPFFEIGG